MKRSAMSILGLFVASITLLMFQNCSQNNLTPQGINQQASLTSNNNLRAAVIDSENQDDIVRVDEQVEQNGYFLAELSCVNNQCKARKLSGQELNQIASQTVACEVKRYMASEVISSKYYGCVHVSMVDNSGIVNVMMRNAYDNFLKKNGN